MKIAPKALRNEATVAEMAANIKLHAKQILCLEKQLLDGAAGVNATLATLRDLETIRADAHRHHPRATAMATDGIRSGTVRKNLINTR